MSKLIVAGGNTLAGTLRNQGAKNSILPILAATLLNAGQCIIHDCPCIRDVDIMIEILKYLGCSVQREGTTVIVDSSVLSKTNIPLELMNKLRSSFVFLGAILARASWAKCSYPGGCELGPRPINLHISGFKQLGIEVVEANGIIYCEAKNLKPAVVNLEIPSVGATENIMLAACLGDGTTTILNAAKEPEIADLQDFLNKMGARIKGAGSSTITIEGVKSLYKNVEKRVMPDRIVAATYLAAVAAAGGYIEISNVNISHIKSIITVLRNAGANISTKKDILKIQRFNRLNAVDTIETKYYPGFPTDAQPPVLAALTIAKGKSVIKETIFENRFKYTEELIKMGADITISDTIANVNGVDRLIGTSVTAKDLRGGAALIVAALAAEGVSEINDSLFIERGYDNLSGVLAALGADIKRME